MWFFSDVATHLSLWLLALPAHLLDFLGLWEPLAMRLFPHFYAKVSIDYHAVMHSYKKKLFSRLSDFAGPSGPLKVLELGCGTGSNFPFYPRGAKVTCTDANPHFQEYLRKSQAENDHLHFEPNLVAPAENLSEVGDASVDVVVSTAVLCSVNSVQKALKEVLRILKPGGAFFFLEHVCADPLTWTYIFQKIYDPSWKCVFAGCNLCRETWKDLEKAPFSEMKLQHIMTPFLWRLMGPHIIGYGIK
ncbi:thiol S-methyltransferase TMT1A-like [Ambystoma mexicanum]|uniref:thiol S-methyltransferase TMT1A-like n=1 Tax=Ambystoma mexicanum TaxID=8296 RepID=UPI0037E78866